MPNCFRVFEYSSVAEFSSPIAPTASAQSAPMARSRQASSAATPSPSLPSNWLAARERSSRLTSAARRPSMVLKLCRCEIGRMTIDHEQAHAAAVALVPEVRAETIS